MALIIYKQRHRAINYPDTPACNYAHLRYIARRRGVVKNEGMNHGLFGKLEPGEMQRFESWKQIASHIYQLSKEGKNIYRAVISFERNTARELGLIKQSDWRRYVEARIAALAEKNGIKIQNLGFACAVHDERHHPHEKARDWFETFDEDTIFSDPVYWMFHDKTMLPVIKKLFEIKILIPPRRIFNKKKSLKTSIFKDSRSYENCGRRI